MYSVKVTIVLCTSPHVHNTLYCYTETSVDKVETIGDAYMVASGLPTVYELHAQEMSLLALELRDSVKQHVIQHLPDEKTQLRIGLHTGFTILTIIILLFQV